MRINFIDFIKRHVALTVLMTIAIGSGLAFAMGDKPETYSWRYKTTIVVDTPEGIKTGSAVREMIFVMHPCPKCLSDNYRAKISTKGEAVVIDLGKRGIAFALINGDAYQAIFDLFPGPGGATMAGVKYYSTLKNAKASLNQQPFPTYPTTQYPTMVTFKDIKDPKTVELAYQSERIRIPNQMADDYKITDNFEKLFGKGVKIKDVTVEMTGENVTKGILKYLPIFDEEYRKWVGTLTYGDPRKVDNRNFLIGE